MRSDVPDRYRAATLDSYDGTVSPSAAAGLRAARDLVDGRIRTLGLVGPPGVGKTHLAVGVFKLVAAASHAEWLQLRQQHLERFEPVPPWAEPEWCNVPELLRAMRAEMRSDAHAAADRAARLGEVRGLVVLDDLGRERVSDWTGEVVYGLVNARYEAMLPTIATSNLDPDGLAANGYWPAFSRLAEDGVLVEITAPDRRLEVAG